MKTEDPQIVIEADFNNNYINIVNNMGGIVGLV